MPFAVVAGALVMLAVVLFAVRSIGGGPQATESPGPTTGSPDPTSPAPTTSPLPTSPTPATPTLVPLPACTFGDQATPLAGLDEWARTVLDTNLRLPASYQPPDLAGTGAAGFLTDLPVRTAVVGDLTALGDAARDAGHEIDVIAAYRSHDEQAALFARREEEFGHEEALRRVARPGHSEHQLGTAVDFRTEGEPDVTAAWADTSEGGWMLENASRFGFVLSYPARAEDVTCYTYEPWHYRYVGPGVAARVVASGLTLREFLWHWQETGLQP